MQEEILNLTSLGELHKVMGVGSCRHPLLTIIDLSKVNMDESLKNRRITMNFYSITLKLKQCAAFKYGRGHFDFDGGSLIAMEPFQVISSDNAYQAGELEGWALYFHPDFLLGHQLHADIKKYGYFAYDVDEALHLSEIEISSVGEIIKKIEAELDQNMDDFSHDIQLANIDLLLKYVDRYFNRQFITRKVVHQEILAKVSDALHRYYVEERFIDLGLPTVNYLAEQVFLSPKYLSDLLKKETGMGAQETIHNYLLDLAKQKLLSTNYTVSEISYSLGFEYPQYFSRMFKNNTGLTPKQFRYGH